MPIFDNHGRPIQYLRLAVTDRCNLRCFYCMPEEGIKFVPRNELLTYEELERLVKILAPYGVSKIRITGGEPFVRRDLISFLENLTRIEDVSEIHITTNGVLTWKYIDALKAMEITSINLSLDTMDPDRFLEITRRDVYKDVMKTMDAILKVGIPLKINCVVMDGVNGDDILPLVELGRNSPISVRFIEEMPFNGEGARNDVIFWNHERIMERIRTKFPDLKENQDAPHSTSRNYRIPGFEGSVGVIAAFSRTFCNACNRIRITALGQLKTCLYDTGVLDLKALLRSTKDDQVILDALLKVFGQRPKDGFEAEAKRLNGEAVHESMSTIGG